MRNRLVFLAVYLITYLSLSAGCLADQLVREIQPGRKIIIETKSNCSYVLIQFLVDKTKISEESRLGLYTEYFIKTMERRFESLGGLVISHGPRFIPDSPYNWLEQGLLTVILSSDDFLKNLGSITTLIINPKTVIPMNRTNFIAGRNAIKADSVFYDQQVYQLLKQIMFLQPKRFNANDRELDLVEEIQRHTHVYFFGNLNPVDLVSQFENNSAVLTRDSHSAFTNQIQTSCRTSVEQLRRIVQVDCGPISLPRILASEALKHCLHSALSKAGYSARTYSPWQNGHLRLVFDIIFRDSSAMHDFSVNRLTAWIGSDTTNGLNEWYFREYLPGLNFIEAHPERRILLRQLSELYFDDADRFFRVYTQQTFPKNEIREYLTEWIALWRNSLMKTAQ
jgi:hypothetical protein